MTAGLIDRGFVRLTEGLVHYRAIGGRAEGLPIVLLHASPGSSKGLEPLLDALAATGAAPRLIAPDTLGHGDSAPPAGDDPGIADYADALVRVLEGLGIGRAIVYGAHTGARIACEAGIRHPDRVAQVIVDGIGEYDAAARADLLARYAPAMTPDDYGTQMIWAFNFVRDQALHFPYYARDPQHRLMSRAVPDAETLHRAALEVLKALGTYHLAYRAAFRYPTRARLALLTRPLVLLDAATELPVLREQTRAIIAAAPQGRVVDAGTTISAKARAILKSAGDVAGSPS